MQLIGYLLIPLGLYYGYWLCIRKVSPIAATITHTDFEPVVPVIADTEMELLYEPSPQIGELVLIQTDETILLMEAEKIITEIETIVLGKENVLDKLRALLRGFNLFYNTDYQDAINRFITAVLKRESGLELNEAEIAALWN